MWSCNQKTREQKKKGRKKSYKSKQNYKENGNKNIHINNYNIINYTNNYLNEAGLKSAKKRHRLGVWVQKQDPYIMISVRDLFYFLKSFIILYWGIPD